jgi:5-methylcytosine-specific restriction endonuclease McrA
VKRYSLSHLSDESLLRGLTALVAQDCITTAEMLAHVAEVDERKLYLPAGHPSMFLYCVQELHLSEDAAAKRIQAARAARRFPAIFTAVGSGRLHLSGVVLLAPHLVEETAADLIAAAGHKTKSEIEQLLADRYPKSDLLTWLAGPPPTAAAEEHAPGLVDDAQVVAKSSPDSSQLVPGRVESRARVTPLSSQSVAFQATLSRATSEKLRYAQELLGHQVPSGDLAQVLDRVLDLAITQLEKQKFGATSRPRGDRGYRSANPRYIPLHVRRAVWKRDAGRCTFVSETGHRCEARKPLEFDHVLEVARGGEASVDDIRLRCRAHNQYAAECTFGADFMRHKRIAAAEAREVKARAPAAGAN